MRQNKFSLVLGILLTAILLLNGCSTAPSSKSPAAPPEGITGTITTGKQVSAATATINPTGGTVTVTDQASPLAGLEIVVPPNSYSSATPFKVSYSPIEKHSFGEGFNPVSPMITVDNGGGYSEEIMEVKIPVKVPPGHFAMGFLYDDKTGQLEGLPLVIQDADSITIATRHFSKFIISSEDRARLQKNIQSGFESGFQPGVDDWQFTNRGSFIAPNGHCAGQSIAAMWYYIARPDGRDNHLFGRYDNNGNKPATPDLWRDDSLGYRFSSVVQKETDWDSLSRKIAYKLSKDEENTWYLFAYSMQQTGQPQMVEIINTNPGGSVHAMVVYKVSGNKLFVADPNYPAKTDRFIEYANGKFKPYNSGANRDAIDAGGGELFDQIVFMPTDFMVDLENMGQRWDEVKNRTIGNDYFPGYEVRWVDEQNNNHKLEDGYVSPTKLLKLNVYSPKALIFHVYRNGNSDVSIPDARFPDAAGFELKSGNNLLGILINGVGANNTQKYIDFKYFNIVYTEAIPPPSTKVWTLAETRIDPPEGTLAEPARVRNDYTVAAGSITHKTSFNSTSFGWNVATTFTFDKPPATMKPGDLVNLQTTGTVSKSGNLPPNPLTYEFSYNSGYWIDNSLQSGGKPDYPQLSSVGGFPGLTLDAHESVFSKTVGVSFGVPEAHPQDIAIQVREGRVSVTWIYRAK